METLIPSPVGLVTVAAVDLVAGHVVAIQRIDHSPDCESIPATGEHTVELIEVHRPISWAELEDAKRVWQRGFVRARQQPEQPAALRLQNPKTSAGSRKATGGRAPQVKRPAEFFLRR